MAITLVGLAEGSDLDGNNFDITLPGGTTTGDCVFVFARNLANPGVATAGYTDISAVTPGPCWRKILTSAETIVTITGSGNAANGAVALVSVLRGVDATTPEDAATTSANNTAGNQPDSPSITTVTNGAWVFSCASRAVNDTAVTNPSGYTDQNHATVNDTSVDGTVATARIEKTTAGAENPGAWSGWLTTGVAASSTVAFRPSLASAIPRLMANYRRRE